MALTITILYYVSMLAYYPILGILIVVPYCMGVSLVALLVMVLVRDDLVADIIARTTEKPVAPKPQGRKVTTTVWTSEAASITHMPMPPTLWFQMFVNLMRKHKAAELAPVNKRLTAVAKLLAGLESKTRQARTEIDLERMYLNAWSNKLCETRSTATNTEHRNMVPRKSPAAPEQDTTQDTTPDTTPNVGDLSTVIEVAKRIRSTIGSLLGIAVRLLKIILWVVKIVISLENLKRILKINHFLRSQYAKNIVKTIVDNFNNIFSVTTLVNIATDATNYSLAMFPKPGQTFDYL